MRQSYPLILGSILLLLTQTLSPALAAVWLASMGPVSGQAPGAGTHATAPVGQNGVTLTGDWVVVCTATGLKRLFLTADGRLVDPTADTATPGDGIAPVCPYTVLTGALDAAPPPMVAQPTAYALGLGQPADATVDPAARMAGPP